MDKFVLIEVTGHLHQNSVNMLLFLHIKENSVDFVEWHLIIIEFWQVKGLLLTTSKCTGRCFSEVWCKFDSKDSQLVGKMGKLGFYMGLKICGSLGVWSENCDMIWKSENLKVLYLRSCFFVPLCKCVKSRPQFLSFPMYLFLGLEMAILKKSWKSVEFQCFISMEICIAVQSLNKMCWVAVCFCCTRIS